MLEPRLITSGRVNSKKPKQKTKEKLLEMQKRLFKIDTYIRESVENLFAFLRS